MTAPPKDRRAMLDLREAYGRTDRGRRRKRNEDQFLVATLTKSLTVRGTSLQDVFPADRRLNRPSGHLFIVADGMGGHDDGDTASAVAVNAATHCLWSIMPSVVRLGETDREDLEDDLVAIIGRSHREVRKLGESEGYDPDMGTTLTMAYVLRDRAYLVHVGDSRCYLLRDQRLKLVTRDHTLAQQLVDRQVLTPKRAEDSQWNHQLWNAIGGGSDDLTPDVHSFGLQAGDRLLLSTDGLTGHLEDRMIEETLTRAASAEAAVEALIEAANEAGGSDNLTAVLARFERAEDDGETTRPESLVPSSMVTLR